MINLLGWPEGLAVPLITHRHPGGGNENLLHGWKRTPTDNGRDGYDGQVHMRTSGEKGKRRTWLTSGHTCRDTQVDVHFHHNTNTRETAPFFFLPSCRRWWTRPRCSLCCLPPPRHTPSLQTWQTTGNYCKAKRARSRLCQSRFLSSAQHNSLLEKQKSGISKEESDRSSPLVFTCVHSLQLWLSSSELTGQLLSVRWVISIFWDESFNLWPRSSPG